jgi:hypothetical protein
MVPQSLALFDGQASNQSPVPANYSLATRRALAGTLNPAKLLRLCTDAEGDALTISAVSAASSAGQTVSLAAGGFRGPRHVHLYGGWHPCGLRPRHHHGHRYRRHGPNVLGILPDTPTVNVRFAGAPSLTCPIEAATNRLHWTHLGQATAGSNGIF